MTESYNFPEYFDYYAVDNSRLTVCNMCNFYSTDEESFDIKDGFLICPRCGETLGEFN